MPRSSFCRTTANTFINIFLLAVITLAALSAQAMMVVKEQYRLTDIWPTRPSFLRLDLPAGLAADSRGYLYIADRGLNRILKLTPDGRLADQWGRPGIAAGEFDSPSGIAMDSLRNLVYVADTGNDRIQIFTRHGDFIDQWRQWNAPETDSPETDFAPFAFHQPQGVAVDSNGFVYVADTGNDRILKFTSDGVLVTQWGGQGSGPGQFSNPESLMIYGDSVYVADTGNFRAQQFTLNGQYITQWGGSKRFKAPAGIAFGPDGRIYVTDKANIENPSLMKFTDQGHVVYTDQLGNEAAMPAMQPDASLSIWSPVNAGLQNPEGMVTGPDGLIYVADTGNSRIVCLTENGSTVDAFPANGNAAGLFDAPAVVTGDALGNIFVGDQSTTGLLKITAQGILADAPLNFNAFTGLSGAVLDADGNFYIADANSVLKFDANGDPVPEWTSVAFDTPRGLAIDAAGSIYVADSGNDRICKLDPVSGALTTEWGGLNQPADIVIASDGLVYVADSGSRGVQVFNTDGELVRQWNHFDYPLKYFEDPQGIAADKDGNIYVADAGAGRVYKFNPWGSLLAEIGGPGDSAGGFIQPADVYVDSQGRVFVVDTVKQNVQVFQNQAVQPPSCGRQKAIIVAGSRPDDLLWENTQMCANLAYNALCLQGFTADAIRYLSANTDLDITNDDLPDVEDKASLATLKAAVQWAGKDTDSVVIYMVDHGGNGRFRLSGNEILDAATLDGWLDDLQKDANNPIPAAIVLDACRAASFMDTLKASQGQTRLVIASAGANQDAGFAGYAALSFSNYFWSDILMGKTVAQAFETAQSAVSTIYSDQTPVMEPADGVSFCLGNRIESDDPPPEIGSVKSEPAALDGTSEAAIIADGVTDKNGQIQRVWAHISPPRIDAQAYNPILNLPNVDLLATDTAGQYRALWKRFSLSGEYSIAAFATDDAGQISEPRSCTLRVTHPVSSKAILVAGAAGGNDDLKNAIEANIRTAYDALVFQGYRREDIYVISEADVVKEYDKLAPSLDHVEKAIQWAALNTQDVLLYMTGKGAVSQFILSETDVLEADVLDGWLNQHLKDISGIVTVVYDACYSESFLAPLSDKERIVISSAPTERCALMQDGDSLSDCLNQSGEHSFSAYFWKGVKNGLSVGRAFDQARLAVETVTSLLLGGLIEPQLDDTGNGIGNEPEDGVLAGSHYIGAGFELADDGPVISNVSDSQTLTDDTYRATLWAEVTATAGVSEVWAVITPPDYQIEADAAAIMDLDTVKLTRQNGSNRYEGIYENFNVFGIYGITIHARDADCKVSLPASTRVNQTQNAGNCLKSINIGDQVHSFWSADCPHPDGGYVWEYTFNIDGDQSVSIKLDSNAENTLLYLIDENGTVIGPLNGDPQQIIESLGTGQYTIKVITTDDSLPDYKLEVKLADPLPPKGTLQVNIIPQEALTDGAQWRIDGEEWRDSGSVHTSLAMGAHKVMFKPLPGWVRPDTQDIVLSPEEPILVTAEYQAATEIFAAAYGGEDDDETLTASALMNDGSLVATGYVTPSASGASDLWVVKFNSAGMIQKQFTFGGDGDDKGWSIDALPDDPNKAYDGGAVIAGVTPSADGDRDLVVIKLDKDAEILWKKTYGGAGKEDHPHIRSRPDGNFILVAESDSFTPGYTAIWAAELTPAGEIKWQYTYLYNHDLYNNGDAATPKALVVSDADNNYSYLITAEGKLEDSDNSDFWVIKLDEDGQVKWQKTFGAADADEIDPHLLANDRGYLLAGTIRALGFGIENIWIGQLEPTLDGNVGLTWQKTIEQPNEYLKLADIGHDIDGGQIVTGNQYDGAVTLFKLTADGAIAWQQRYTDEETGAIESCGVHPFSDNSDVRYMIAGNRLQGKNDYFLFRTEADGSLPGGCEMERGSDLRVQNQALPPVFPSANVVVSDPDPKVTPVSDHFTVMAWINVFNFKARNVVFWSQDDRPGMEVTDNQIRFIFKQNGVVGPLEGEPTSFLSTQTIEKNEKDEWAHVACTWDGQFYKGYVNGQWAGEIELPYFDLGGQIRIGQDDGPKSGNDPSLRNFDGLIDEVRIYAEALSEDQIQKAMDSNCQLSDSGAWIRNQVETVYEDAEDGSSDRWIVYADQEPEGATFFNVYDEERESRVIEVHGTGSTNPAQDGFKLYDFENTDQFIAQWSMKLIETPHTIYWDIETADGNRLFIDYRADRPKECIVNPHDDKYITCGLGAEIKDGQWHTIVRDLRADLKYADPENELLKVKSFRIRGHAYVDDIKLRSVWPAGEDPTFSDDNCTAEHGGAVDFTADTGDLKGDFRFEGDLQEQVNSLEGSPEGSVGFISSHDGQGIELYGGNYVDYGSNIPGTDFTGKEAFSVSMWVRDGSRGVALSRYTYYFTFTDDNIVFRLKKQDTGSEEDQDPYHLNVPYPDNWKSGQWNHVTFVHFIQGQDDWQTVDRLIYVNGRLAGGTPEFYDYNTPTFESQVPLRSLKIGKTEHQGGMYFTGGLDEVRIFRRALTPCEIEVLASGLKGHWKFNEYGKVGAKYMTDDSSGYGNDAQYFHTRPGAGYYGEAFDFSLTTIGGTEVIARVQPPGTMSDYTSGPFTIMAWINPYQLKPDSYIFHSADGGPGIKIADNGGVKFCIGSDCLTSGPISAAQWHHLACTWDGASYTGFIDGLPIGAQNPTTFTLGGAMNIGQDSSDNEAGNFDGMIDDVRIYNRAMTSSEIAAFVPEINPEANLKLTAITPVHGAADGGDEITITGEGFTAGAGVESVTFGGLPAKEVTVESDTKITCKAPAHPVENVNVVVTLADGQSVGRHKGYIYTGMAAHWKFDNDYKEEVSGVSGAKYGTENDDFSFWEGHDGNAAAFDGADDYVNYGDLPNTDFTGEDPFSVTMWVKDGSEGWMMSRWRYFFLIRNNQIWFEFKKNYDEQDLYPLITPIPSNWNDDGWNHLAFVYGENKRTIYVNGLMAKEVEHERFNSTYGLRPLKIGKSDHLGGKYFAGLLDDVQIYNRALSPCEIELMNTPPAGRWPFDEADGNVALDATGRGNDGEIIGTAREPGQTGFGGALDFGVDNDLDNHKDRVILPRTMQYYISANMHAEDSDESPYFYCSPHDGENQIAAVPPPHVISSGTADKLWADVDFEGKAENVKVWAEITAPNGETFEIDADQFVYNDDTGLWEADIANLNLYGEYEITIYAQIGEDTLEPETTAIFQDSQPDTYEDDNTCEDANDIQRHEIQHHNFHIQGDQDWVKFDGTEGEIYRIEVTDADVLCDAVIEVYNDNCELLASYDQGWAGDDEVYEFDETTYTGIYYVKIRQYDATVAGAFTGYDLRVYAPTAPVDAVFTGDLSDNTTYQKLSSATVTVKNNNNSFVHSNANQSYLINAELEGGISGRFYVLYDYTYDVEARCYESITELDGEYMDFGNGPINIIKPFFLNPKRKGDLTVTNNIGAQWRIKKDGYTWKNSGDTQPNLDRGETYTVEFKAEDGDCWAMNDEKWCITDCEETEDVQFSKKKVNLTVNIEPETVKTDARWFLDGNENTAYQSGDSIAVTYCEEHTISFNDIQGWRTLSPITVTLSDAGQENTISAEYISLLDPFAAAYGGYRNEKIIASDAAADGGHVFAGWSESFGEDETFDADIWIIKLDKRGEIVWQQTLGQAGFDEFGYSVQQTDDDGYIVAGVRSSTDGSDDLVVFKLSAEGTIEWQSQYDADNEELNAPVIRQTDSDYILAAEIGAVNAKDIVLMRFEENGVIKWQKRYNGTGSETDPSIDLTEDGHVVVACTTQQPEGNRDILVFKVSATDGLKTDGWTYTFDGGRDDFTPKIRTTSDGCMVAATTKSFGTGEPHILLIKLNDKGAIQDGWPKTIGQAGESHTLADFYTTTDGCMIAGNRRISTFKHALTLFKVDGNGALSWSKVYNPDAYTTEARAVHETIDGRTTVSGWIALDGHTDFLVLATDQTGSAPDCSLGDMSVSFTSNQPLTMPSSELSVSDNQLSEAQLGYEPETTQAPAHFLCKPLGKGPQITAVSDCQNLACDGSADEVSVWAKVSCDECIIEKVWAVINPPGDLAPTTTIDMKFINVKDGYFAGQITFDQFTSFGRYDITIYAKDTDGNTAMPETTCIEQPAGPDEYENDNEWENATSYFPGADAQTHNFNSADQVDWVRFMACYGLYEIKIADISVDTQIEVKVYSYPFDEQPDQPVLLEKFKPDDNNEIHIPLCSRDRQWYFLEIQNTKTDSPVCGAGYTVQIEYAHELGDIDGDLDVDLADAIIGLRVMAGFAPDIRSDYQDSCTDVNQIETATQRIDMGEILYIMEKNAGMRKCWDSY